MSVELRNSAHERGSPTLRRFLLVMAAAVLLGVIPFLSGLVGALMLYVVTHRAHERLARRVSPRLSALAVVLGVFVLLLVPGTWLISTIVTQGTDAARTWLA